MNAKRKRFFVANGNELCADGVRGDTFSYEISQANAEVRQKGLKF